MRLVGVSIVANVSAAILHWFTTSSMVNRGYILEMTRQPIITRSFFRVGDEDIVLLAYH
jgi:hypothetical protein